MRSFVVPLLALVNALIRGLEAPATRDRAARTRAQNVWSESPGGSPPAVRSARSTSPALRGRQQARSQSPSGPREPDLQRHPEKPTILPFPGETASTPPPKEKPLLGSTR